MVIDELDDRLAEVTPDVLDRVNGAFSDSVLFVTRVLAAADDAREAEIVAVDARGIDVETLGDGGLRTVRIDFLRPVEDPELVGTHLLELVTHARERSGEPGQTSAERELASMGDLRTFITQVAAVETVHPHLRRITLGGGDLDTFTPVGPDMFVYVLLPPPGRNDLTIDRSFSWEHVAALPAEDQPVGAYYTVRSWRPDRAELDLLFFLHHPSGPASAWAEQARPGDPVALWGPRDSFEPPDETQWYLLVADDTGLPAVAAILEALPEDTPVQVVAEVRDEHERQPLRATASLEVTWVHRDGVEAGTVPERTIDAVRSLRLPDGPGYVWGGGESRAITAVRRYLRQELGMPRERVALIAYWRHQRAARETKPP